MQDISGFGIRATVVASVTFPQGFTVTQFADDSDPIDTPSQQIMDGGMGVNGDFVAWSKANPISASIGVTPDSDDDRNLAALAEANRVSRGKTSARDIITLTIVYPDESTVTLNNGKLMDAPLATSVASAGRKKSKVYSFKFEGRGGTA